MGPIKKKARWQLPIFDLPPPVIPCLFSFILTKLFFRSYLQLAFSVPPP